MLHECFQRQLTAAAPVQNRLNDIRRKQRQPEHSAHVRLIDALVGGEFGDRSVGPILNQLAPAVGASERLDDGVVKPRVRRLMCELWHMPDDGLAPTAGRADLG